MDVTVKSDRPAQEYCFIKQGLTPSGDTKDWLNVTDSGEPADHFRVYKFDGLYTLWVRDAEKDMIGSIDVNVVSGFRYPINAENLEPIHQSLKEILTGSNSSVKELNERIATDIATAGFYTREGVVTAGVSLISHVSEYGYSIVRQGKGSYQEKDDWGVNPKWGLKLDAPTSDANGTYYYSGMQPAASIVWAYKQAGMNLLSKENSSIGKSGEHKKSKDNQIQYDCAKSGDIIQSGETYLMVVDRLDQNHDGTSDAYLAYEMSSHHLSFTIVSFAKCKNRRVYSMDAFFTDTGNHIKDALYWQDSFRIPKESMPQYLQNAYEQELSDRSFSSFLKEFGLQ